MKKGYLFFFLIGLIPVNGFSNWKLEPALDSLVVRGIDLIWKQEYKKADSVFSDVVKKFPHHPAGYLYRATLLQAYAVDYDVSVDQQKFDSLIYAGRERAVSLPSPWKEYFLGTAEGCEAYERVESGKWLSGIQKGMASAAIYEEILELDSTFYDAYIGIGTYYYWSSKKTSFIRWLPFVKDNRDLGISLLKMGAEKSEYNKCAALSALISIALDAEFYPQAERWSQQGLVHYPQNRIFLWGLATAFERQNRYTDAIAAYSHLLKSILQSDAPHAYGEVVCRLNFAKSLLAAGDTVSVKENLLRILTFEKSTFPDALKPRVQAKFKETHAILSQQFQIPSRVK